MTEPSTKQKTSLPWSRAEASAFLALAIILPLAIVFNVAIGRMIHWDIVAALSVIGSMGLTLAFRYAR